MNVHTLSLFEVTKCSFEIFLFVIFLVFAANAVSLEGSEKSSDSLISTILLLSSSLACDWDKYIQCRGVFRTVSNIQDRAFFETS